MSFEMKYDKNGMPIKGQNPVADNTETTPTQEIQEQVEQNPEQNLQQETQEIEQNEPKTESTPLKVKTSDKEENFARMREKSAKLERERDEAIRMAQELQAKYQQSQPQQQEEDLSININSDDLVEGKHLNKLEKKIKKLEEQIRQSQQNTREIALEAQLKAQYPDFDKIVCPDNVNLLKEMEPDIAEAIANTQDIYKKASLAYKMIKKLNIVTEDKYQSDRDLALKNATKPKPTNTISPQQGDTPLSKANAFANGLTDELKEQLRKEMSEYRKGY
jgi:hypothetical protein